MSIRVQGTCWSFRIIVREDTKCIMFEGDKSPVTMYLWIQVIPVGEEQVKMRVTIRAKVNMFMKAMVSKPLQEGVEKLADMLAMIPY